MTNYRVFDGHCDTPIELWLQNQPLLENTLAVSLARAQRLGGWAQFFAFCTAWVKAKLPRPEIFSRALDNFHAQLRENADVQGTNAKQTELRRRLNEAEDRLAGHDDAPKSRPQAARAIRVGDTVELIRFGTRASVLAINKDGSYLLQAGIMKVTAQPDEVYLIEETKQQAKKIIERSQRAFRSAGASTELDLRGMSADEAIATLDIFLDNAMMANLASVRIIHGKGTGVLRKAVQDELKRNRCVKRYRLGVYGEGEDGVTIAELA